jgi:hypothetical protein
VNCLAPASFFEMEYLLNIMRYLAHMHVYYTHLSKVKPGIEVKIQLENTISVISAFDTIPVFFLSL